MATQQRASRTSGKKKKTGRPSAYTDELADRICDLLSDGISLRRVCGRRGMPSKVTVLSWLRTNDRFLTQYIRAKDESADALADDIADIADDVRRGKLDPNAGRVAGDLKKWSASKLKPKKYGDKVDLTTAGKELPTPIFGGLSVAADNSKAST